MSNTTITSYARAISDLHDANQYLDPNSFVEVSKKNDSGYTSYKTTLRRIGESVISDFALYNNVNNVFDSPEHPNETYFPSSTTFKHNPYIQEENSIVEDGDFETFPSNRLVTKGLIKDYFKNTGICVPVCTALSDYYYYSVDEKRWIKDNEKIPKVLGYSFDGIWTSESKVKFNYGHNLYCYTEEVEAPKNIMLDVTGNIVLNKQYDDKHWFEDDLISFVALTIDSKIITLAFLKNVLLLKSSDGKEEYVIAQFHFHCPLAKGTKFKIITNAECKLFGVQDKDQFSKKLYNSLNAVNLSFYDFPETV